MSDLKNSQRAEAETETVLRVLAGANAGAQLALRDGVWLVGSGEAADITFAEPALVAEHVRLLLERDRVGIEVLADGVLIGAEPAAAGLARGLQAFEMVSIGATVFTTGRAGSAWPDPAVALRPTPELAPGGAEPAPAPPPTEPTPEARGEAPAAPARASLSVPSPSRAGRLLPVAGIGLLLLMVGTGCWWWLSQPAPPPPAEAEAAAPLDQAAVARQVIDRLGLSDRLAIARNNDRTTVNGQMRDEQGVGTLVRALRDAGFTGEVSVMTDAAAVDAIHTIMTSFGVTVNISMAGPGAVVLTGFASDADRIATALQGVRSDVPGIKTIDDQIQTPDRARATLLASIRTAGLGGALAVSAADADALTVRGSLAPDAMEKWMPIAAAFHQVNGDRIRLVQQITPTLGVTPRGVELGRQPHLVLDDGRRLGVGDMLDSIGRIVAISDRNVRVATSSGQINVPFTHPPVWITEDANAR